MNELDQILDGLVQRTVERKLVWNQSIPEGRFATYVDAISVEIESIDDGSCRLDIYNESGVIAVSLTPRNTNNKAQYEQLARLHALALRSAFDVDATLEKLVKGLDL